MSPVAADTMHSSPKDGSMPAATPLKASKLTPASNEANTNGDLQLHTETQCEGAYCNFVIPDQAQAVAVAESKDTAGMPSETSTAVATPEVAPKADDDDVPELHTETQCEGAYCNFVIPDKAQAAALAQPKDAAATSGNSSAATATPATAPKDNDMQELHTETQCEGAYCNFVIPDAKQAAEVAQSGKDTTGIPSESPIVTPASAPEPTDDAPELHTETQCEGAYCNFVIPNAQQAAEVAQSGKDTAGISSDSSIVTPAPAPEPTDDLPELHTETQCEGAYCNFVIPTAKQAAELAIPKDGNDSASETSTAVATPAPSTPNLPEMHIDTQCEGAYCNFVVPGKKQSTASNTGKDDAGVTSPPQVTAA